MTLEELFNIIQKRKRKMPPKSYVASLIRQGEDTILQKIGEEATEVIIGAKGSSKKRIIAEIADLFFMILIMMVEKNISLKEIYKELDKRNRKHTLR